jgi:hypothetical protein
MTRRKKQRVQGRHRASPNACVVPLTTDQQQAIIQFQKDFHERLRPMQETRGVAERIWRETVDAPRWRIAETTRPDHLSEEPPQLWTVGHAKVNYVDKIDSRRDEQ